MLYLDPSLNKYVSPLFMIAVSAVYLLLCFFGKRFMSTRSPISVGSFPILYNLFQVLLSIYMSWGIFGPGGLGSSTFVFGLNSTYSYRLEYFVWIHYWSKMIDFVDTILILLKKNDRQLNFLHVYHHSSIVIIWGLLLHFSVGNGTTAFGAGINSFIHAIMYTHYLVLSLGLQNPYKKYLTGAQLIQFALCVMHSVLVGFLERSPVQPWWLLQFLYQLSMLYLFMDFYKRTYGGKKD
eukprot:TRINITY_DN620_c0_g1_i1.p1 TRINITY_DN620_c0_g1~~TRINITY_DN620_c0_g1_i1.p1  ORF type:complete len:237 (-),score=12.41 TRINITY_DN620_c0_g1_i1:231-941(-)